MTKYFSINAPWKEYDPIRNFMIVESAHQIALRIAVAKIEDVDKEQILIAQAADKIGIKFEHLKDMVEREKKNWDETKEIVPEMSDNERLSIMSMPIRLHTQHPKLFKKI